MNKTSRYRQHGQIVELPDSAYDKARKRYEDLGEWFDRDESAVSETIRIFSAGIVPPWHSVRPLDESEEYDLDLACKLRDGSPRTAIHRKPLKADWH